MVWGLGKKVQSSSWLLEKFNNQENDYWEYKSNQVYRNVPSSKMRKKYQIMWWSLLGLMISTLIILLTQLL